MPSIKRQGGIPSQMPLTRALPSAGKSFLTPKRRTNATFDASSQQIPLFAVDSHFQAGIELSLKIKNG
jgi:hypothetical protein